MANMFLSGDELATKSDIAALNPNLIRNSSNFIDTNGWLYGNSVASAGGYMTLTKHPFWQNGNSNIIGLINPSTSNENWAYTPTFDIEPNTTYQLLLGGFADANCQNADVWLLSGTDAPKDDTDNSYTNPTELFTSINLSPSGLDNRKTIFTTNATDRRARIRFDNNRAKNSGGCGLYICYVMLQKFNISMPLDNSFYLKNQIDEKIANLQNQINQLKK